MPPHTPEHEPDRGAPTPPPLVGTPVEVLLTHGLTRDTVGRLQAAIPRTELVAVSVTRHEEGRCAFGPQPCPWHIPGALAGDVHAVLDAVNAWCAVGWIERGLLGRLPRA